MVKGKVCESLVRYKCEVLDWATNKGEHWESNTDKINKERLVWGKWPFSETYLLVFDYM